MAATAVLGASWTFTAPLRVKQAPETRFCTLKKSGTKFWASYHSFWEIRFRIFQELKKLNLEPPFKEFARRIVQFESR